MKKFLLGMILMMGISHSSIHNFNEIQKENMRFACVASQDMEEYHEDMCYIFSALVWQESSAGMIMSGGPGHNAYGLFQNYLPTVKRRFKQKGLNYSDRELKELLNDKWFSLAMAKEEFKYWLDQRNNNVFKALASYNAGWNWKRSKSYANMIMEKVRYLKKHGDFLNE